MKIDTQTCRSCRFRAGVRVLDECDSRITRLQGTPTPHSMVMPPLASLSCSVDPQTMFAPMINPLVIDLLHTS